MINFYIGISLYFLLCEITMLKLLAGIGIFHGNLKLHTTHVLWNLMSAWKAPSFIGDLSVPRLSISVFLSYFTWLACCEMWNGHRNVAPSLDISKNCVVAFLPWIKEGPFDSSSVQWSPQYPTLCCSIFLSLLYCMFQMNNMGTLKVNRFKLIYVYDWMVKQLLMGYILLKHAS